MSSTFFTKDPNAVLDFTVNWTTWLNGDTIATSNFTVPSGIVKDSQSNSTTSSTVWLSGGTEGSIYDVLNRITTAGGRTEDKTLTIYVTSH